MRYSRQVVLRVHDPAVLVHHLPVGVVILLDELIELPVLPLGLQIEVQKGGEVVFPVPGGLEDVHVVTDPVVLALQDLPVDEDQPPPVVDIAPQGVEEEAQFRILRGEDGGEPQFIVVVRAVLFPIAVP